ncbi:MAG: hypothetical protein ACLFTH_00950 [Candidatus Woesearchaeota archaeon]
MIRKSTSIEMFEVSLQEILEGVSTIGKALFTEPALLWQLTPIVLVWFILEIYFGAYAKEKLGWNTALANGISLFWIVISGMQYIFSDSAENFSWVAFGIIAFMALYGMLIIVTTFKHSLPKKVEFAIAAPTPVYYFSAIVLLVAYQQITITMTIIMSILALFIFFMVFFWVVKKIIPDRGKHEIDEDEFETFDMKTKPKKSRKSSPDPIGSSYTDSDPDIRDDPLSGDPVGTRAPAQDNPQQGYSRPDHIFDGDD